MLLVGLTGGLASGKTFIGKTLERLGCVLIQADELGRSAIEPEGEAYAGVVAAFGSGILREDGTIDRKRLARIVFEDPGRLAVLNSLVHPVVFRHEELRIARAAATGPRAIVVVEAAIMIEARSHTRYQKLIVAVCSEEQQIERAMRRDGTSREEAVARLGRQMPLADKVKLADYVIDTSGSEPETVQRTKEVHGSLRSLSL